MIAISYAQSGSNVTISLYIEGIFQGSYNDSAAATYNAGNVDILFGARHYTSGPKGVSLWGSISEARIYDEALNLSLIQALNRTDATNASAPASILLLILALAGIGFIRSRK